MPLLTAHHIAKSYGTTILLEDAELHLRPGERIGLVGLNGSGKSSLMRILAGIESADEGEFAWRNDVRVTYLPQTPQLKMDDRLLDVAMQGAARAPGGLDPYEQEAAAYRQLDELGIENAETSVAEASGGMRRKAALAAALLEQPDLLLLDEPTNHLDIGTVQWLERALVSFQGAVLLVTHDRYFLNTVVDRIVEIRKQRLWSWPGTFEDYLEGRLEQEALDARAEHKRKRRLATELDWLRRSPKARTTKQQARIGRAHALMETDYEKSRSVQLQVQQRIRLGKKILDVRDVDIGFPNNSPLIRALTLTMTKGVRVGVVGPNGVGKTTLLRTIVGEMDVRGGKLEFGVNTEPLYIDQARTGLDESATVRESATEAGGDWVANGEDKTHVASYLEKFLFRGDDLRQKVHSLSGGQKFRLLLARKMQTPMNLLLLDEPTNDLDFETLDVLESALVEYQGCMVVVSHDRAFMDRVCNHILELQPGGDWDLHVGNWSEWQERIAAEKKREKADRIAKAQAAKNQRNSPKSEPKAAPAPKLTYTEQARYDGIEAEIEMVERAVADAEAVLADPKVAVDYARLGPANATLQKATAKRDKVYAAWEHLEQKRARWLKSQG